jgi:hypothetical protein
MSSCRRPVVVCLSILAVLISVLSLESRPEPVRAAGLPKPVREPVASKGKGTLKGKVTLKEVPAVIGTLNKDLKAAMEANKQDGKFCLDGPKEQTEQQTWRLGKDNGLADVFVWLAPPEGHYFKIDWEKPTWPKEVVIDQPHCAFIPHAAVLFSGGYNPEKPDESWTSGQKFIVKNSAPFLHNANWQGGDANPGDNKVIAAKSQIEVELRPDPVPVRLKCNVHGWMTAVVRVFDHPYATVTDKDGNYEIKDAPADADLLLMVWHEGYGYISKKAGDGVKLKAGEVTTKDFPLKKAP